MSALEKAWGPVLQKRAAGADRRSIKQQCLLLEIELCTAFRDEVVKYLLRYGPKALSYQPSSVQMRWDAGSSTMNVQVFDSGAGDVRWATSFKLYPDNFYSLTQPTKVRTSGNVEIDVGGGRMKPVWLGNGTAVETGKAILAELRKF